MLTQEHIETFHRDGVVVIEGVFTDKNINESRRLLHEQLLTMGIDHESILNGTKKYEEVGPRGKSRVSNIFYSKWKMDLHLNDIVYTIMKQLMEATYFSDNLLYDTPFKNKCNDIIPYIDRICWRVPDHIFPEGGLGLHMDLNPYNPYACLNKWRPIQSLITLTDHYDSNSGGLRVVKGYHKIINNYFKYDATNKEGPFFRMHDKCYANLQKSLETIYAPAGSLVCWDYRLPHATCDNLVSDDTREVIFSGWLPNIPMNITYGKEQLINLDKNVPPPGIKILDQNKNIHMDRDWKWDDLSKNQKRMLGKIDI